MAKNIIRQLVDNKNNKQQKNIYTRYWAEDIYGRYSGLNKGIEKSNVDAFTLRAILNSIKNFVHIACGEDIPVKFSTDGSNFTDHKTVTISANVDNFDVTVGAALHEGTHVKETNPTVQKAFFSDCGWSINNDGSSNFNFNISATCFRNNSWFSTDFKTYLYSKYKKVIDEAIKDGKNISLSKIVGMYFAPRINQLRNWICDRRIDEIQMENAPGYVGYYQAMYNHYLFDKKVLKKVKQMKKFSPLTWEMYDLMLINCFSGECDTTKLPDLQRVIDMIDYDNISRLKSNKDSLMLAIQCYEVIERNLPVLTIDEIEKAEQNMKNITQANAKAKAKMKELAKLLAKMGGAGSMGRGEKGDDGEPLELTDEDIEEIGEMMQFMNGEGADKESVSEETIEAIKIIDKAQTTVVPVGKDVNAKTQVKSNGKYADSTDEIRKAECIVVNRIDRNFVNNDPFGVTSKAGTSYAKSVEDGIKFGRALAKKLRLRSETRETMYNRLNYGKIDKRMIANLGFGYESVFCQKNITESTPTKLHISIDMSGSMCGENTKQTFYATAAICMAASLVKKLDVVISLRYALTVKGRAHRPIVIIAYDSKIHNIQDFKYFFSRFTCAGDTPESLCFEAISNLIPPSSSTLDSYFINFSDGEPGTYIDGGNSVGDSNISVSGWSYSGDTARRHCKREIEKMEAKGIQILSYFIDTRVTHLPDFFVSMYGKHARAINVYDLPQFAKSLNDKFASA